MKKKETAIAYFGSIKMGKLIGNQHCYTHPPIWGGGKCIAYLLAYCSPAIFARCLFGEKKMTLKSKKYEH